ncbi:MAG: glucosaminidase domain-containing protein [Pseudomonadota bacterium]
MAKSPDRNESHWTGARVWLGIVAGIAGLVLMIAVEMSAGQTAAVPVVRYEPPAPVSRIAIAASPEIAFIVTPTVAELEKAFRDSGYNLDLVRKFNKPVPRLRLAALPNGLADIRNANRRKAVFLALILPLILEANAHIAVERKRLLYVSAMINSGLSFPPSLQAWLSRLAKRYKTEPSRLDVLLKRVDVLPVSLALAQAAIESGWGTSRFAAQGNAIFGQWTTAGGKGLVPAERTEGMTHKVRAFDRLSESVSAYILNLNTHRAYRNLRALRQEAREKGVRPDGVALAAGLEPYSEKGEEYVELLRELIRVNRLAPLDNAILSDEIIGFESGA